MVKIAKKVNYKYHHLTLTVQCAVNHHIWLKEFFYPHFEIVENGSADCSITLIENTDLYEEMLLLGTKSENQQVNCFALDNSMITLPYWHSQDYQWVVYDEKFQVLYLINHNSFKVELLTPVDNKRARVPLMRVMRELAMNESRKKGGIFIHGAALTIGSHGVIIAGEKRAGKTSLLLHLLKHPATCYLSNDRLLAYFVDNQPFLLGMPTITSIRRTSLPLFPGLETRILSSFFHYLLTIEEAKIYQQTPPIGKDDNFGLTPAQFCTILNVQSIAQSPASIVLFPKITQNKGTYKLNRLSLEVAEEYLSKALFAASLNQHQSDLFVLSQEQNNSNYLKIIKQLLAQISCYECELGLNMYQDNQAANYLINELRKIGNSTSR